MSLFDSQNNVITSETIIGSVKEMINDVYIAKDTFSGQKLCKKYTSIRLSDEVYEYLLGKIEIQNYVDRSLELFKKNYKVSCSVLDKCISADGKQFIIKLCVSASFEYINGGTDPFAAYSEEVTVVYDTVEEKIISVLSDENYYDCSMNLFLTQTNSTTIDDRKKKIIDAIDEMRIKENQTQIANETINSSQQRLNSSSIVSYASANYNKVQPASGNGNVPYYDFATITNSYDCTNFISHCMLAGGAKMNYSSNGWFYRSLSSRAPAWSSVNSFYSYIKSNTQTNTLGGTATSYSPTGAGWGIGSVLQIQREGEPSGVYSHSTVITGLITSNAKLVRNIAKITWRTSSTKNGYNIPVSSAYPLEYKRVILPYNIGT